MHLFDVVIEGSHETTRSLLLLQRELIDSTEKPDSGSTVSLEPVTSAEREHHHDRSLLGVAAAEGDFFDGVEDEACLAWDEEIFFIMKKK